MKINIKNVPPNVRAANRVFSTFMSPYVSIVSLIRVGFIKEILDHERVRANLFPSLVAVLATAY